MASAAAADALEGAHILLAEDERLSALITGTALGEAGHHVETVGDGLAALETLDRESFDVLITDWRMPKIDGVDLCRIVRERADTQNLYVIFLSGNDRKEQVVEALSAGADDYLPKPFDPAELLARVRAGLRIVNLQRRLTAANAALAELALTDPLTGLPNRRALDDVLAGHGRRGERRACIAMLDVDGFKAVNDAHGHAAGDAVLVAVADAVRRAARSTDTAARLAGDEFTLLLDDCSLSEAVTACERIRSAVSRTPVRIRDGQVSVTASIGVAPVVDRDDTAGALERADAALYRAKANGRDRVEVSEADVIPLRSAG
jgi:two-component system, cell cycle response regulator